MPSDPPSSLARNNGESGRRRLLNLSQTLLGQALTLDSRTRTFIRDHLDYAYALVETAAAAYELERAARRGDVFGVQPYLNPL